MLALSVDHEWVSESRISQHVEEVMCMELEYKIGIPCVSWFSAPTRLNRTLERRDLKIVKYHQVVNMATTDAISRQIGGEHTHKSCMLASATVLHRTHRKW